MNKDIPIKDMIFDEMDGDIFSAISFVKNPANGKDFIAMTEDTKPVINLEKGTVTGVVLIPNQLIYRNVNGNEFYMRFKEDTIENMALSFMRDGYNNFSIGHEYESYRNYVFESWIKTTTQDKSNDFGFVVPTGTLFITVKVTDLEVLNKINSGALKGFSIEALLSSIVSKFNDENIEGDDEPTFLDEFEKALNEIITENGD